MLWFAFGLFIVVLVVLFTANSVGKNIRQYYFERRSQSFTSGPVISSQIVDWLDSNAGDRLIRLPIELKLGPLGIESAELTSGNVRIVVHIVDHTSATLGLNLKPHCNTSSCRVWLEGKWSVILPDANLSRKERPLFSVFKVIGKADPSDVNVQVMSK